MPRQVFNLIYSAEKMADIAKMLIIVGAVAILIGLVLLFTQKVSFLGKLPGDILIKKDNFTLYFPLTTCILISLILSIISMLWIRK